MPGPNTTNFSELIVETGYLKSAGTTERMGVGTIATTGTQLSSFIAKYACVLSAVQFVGKDALAANDTNYVTFTITNRTTGAGTTAMLAATDANTSKATGGSALAVYVKRTLTLNATPANLVIAAGDTIEMAVAVTGTLANAVTAPSFLLTFTPT